MQYTLSEALLGIARIMYVGSAESSDLVVLAIVKVTKGNVGLEEISENRIWDYRSM